MIFIYIIALILFYKKWQAINALKKTTNNKQFRNIFKKLIILKYISKPSKIIQLLFKIFFNY